MVTHGAATGSCCWVKPMKLGGPVRTWSPWLCSNNKPVSTGTGSFPFVTLAEARKAALENRRATARRHDAHNSVPTLEQGSERMLAIHSASRKDGARSAQTWLPRLPSRCLLVCVADHRAGQLPAACLGALVGGGTGATEFGGQAHAPGVPREAVPQLGCASGSRDAGPGLPAREPEHEGLLPGASP